MILTCSACSTRYLLDQAALGTAGRTVRCARCGHQWYEKAPAAAPAVPSTPRPNVAAAAQPGAARMATAAAGPVRNLPAVARSRWAISRATLGWAAFGAVLVALLLGMWFGRTVVVAAWPATARLYAIVGIDRNVEEPPGANLAMDLAPRLEVENGVPVLVLEGTVLNNGDRTVAVPLLQANLRNDRNVIVDSWTFRVDAERLTPGGSASFRTRKEHPPEGAQQVEVVFTDFPPAAAP